MNTNTTASGVEAFRVVIPARYASSRLPGKALRMLDTKPLIGHVYENACRSGAERVVVATDDIRIAEYIEEVGGMVQMTSPDCASGSDRIAEAIDTMHWPDEIIIVNVQGDEPFLSPQDISGVAVALARHPDASMATLSAPLSSAYEDDASVVKVTVSDIGVALQFSRTFIKCARKWHHHIGVYAYRCRYLRRFTRLPVPEIERHEKLEQLRALYHGDLIYVHEARSKVVLGVDTEKDLSEAIRLLTEKTVSNQ